MRGLFLLLLFTSLIPVHQSMATDCIDADDIFLHGRKRANEYFKKQLVTKPSSDKLEDEELIIAMVNKNPELMFYQNELQALKDNNQLAAFRVMEIVNLKRDFTHPTFHTYTAKIKYRVKGEIRTRDAYFRTNNRVLIPYPEQRLKAPTRKDYVFYRNAYGEIESKDLTKVVLESLDDSPKFSRGMNEIELGLWKKGKLEEIESGRNSNGTVNNEYDWRRYKASTKTHFALEGFNFYNKPHVNFTIPKQVLKQMYKKGYLRITPYTSDINIPIHGMPEAARTPFGLEMEFIVYTEEGRKLLAPYIQAGIN